VQPEAGQVVGRRAVGSQAAEKSARGLSCAILIIGMRRQGGGGTRVGQGPTGSDGQKDRTVPALAHSVVVSQEQWYTLIRPCLISKNFEKSTL